MATVDIQTGIIGLDPIQAAVSILLPGGCTITSISPFINDSNATIVGTEFTAVTGIVTLYENEDRTGNTVVQTVFNWTDTAILIDVDATGFTAGNTVYVDVNGECIEGFTLAAADHIIGDSSLRELGITEQLTTSQA